MKQSYLLLPVIVLLAVSLSFAADNSHKAKHHSVHTDFLDDVDVDIENGTLVFTSEYDNDLYIEISPDYKLYVSGHPVSLNDQQQKLVADYYDHFMELLDRAKIIGKKGAKIGLEGAKVGALAVGAAINSLLDEDDHEIEYALQEKKEELEIRSEELEEMAEEIEIVADELEDIHYQMKDDIPDLAKLSWF